jgi:sugar lactone lactonase YvrE
MVGLLGLLLVFAGCVSSPGAAQTGSVASAPAIAAIATPAADSANSGTASAPAGQARGVPTAEPTNAAPSSVIQTPEPTITILVQNLPGPDDLLMRQDGSLLISDVVDGTIRRRAPDGSLTVMLSGLNAPEGMVDLANGQTIIAEQGTDRLVSYDPVTRRVTPFLQLQERAGQTGVDGIALDTHDPATPSLLVPDSANGTVLRVSPDGKEVTVVGRNFVRPVAAWAEPAGSILVADEFGNALKRIRTDGKVETVANLPQPDDILVEKDGTIYVNTLKDGAVHRIDAGSGADTIIARGMGDPQGLVADAQGNLLVTDSGQHRLVLIRIH